MDPLQQWLGIKSTTLLAGFLGGAVRAIMQKNVNWKQAVFSCFIGAVTAAYFTPIAVAYLPFENIQNSEGAVGYVIGLTGMLIVEGLTNVVRKWKDDPKLPNGG